MTNYSVICAKYKLRP